MKRARAWLDTAGIRYAFHDYKTAGIERERLLRWCAQAGWEKLLNRAGLTFRQLSERDKQVAGEAAAATLMAAQPSLIKRPVLEGGAHLLVGFKAEDYAALFAGRGR